MNFSHVMDGVVQEDLFWVVHVLVMLEIFLGIVVWFIEKKHCFDYKWFIHMDLPYLKNFIFILLTILYHIY